MNIQTVEMEGISLLADSVETDTIVKADSKVTPETNANKANTIAKVDTTAKAVPKAPKQVEEPVSKPKEESVVYDQYAAKDVRVRTGAYRIVGTDSEVKVKLGETTARIAKRTLGPDMECYIEVYNGITGQTELKVGQVLKIPKLEHKKKKK